MERVGRKIRRHRIPDELPYVAFSMRTRGELHPVHISRLARDAMDAEPCLSDVRLTDLRHDFIIRQLETHDWAYVARITGYTVTSFQTCYSPYIKIKNQSQRELQGDDEYRIWQILQAEKETMEGLALSMRWYMNLSLGEMVGLTWDQVDFEKNLLHLPERDVVISASVRRALLAAYEQRGEGDDPHVLLKKSARTSMDVTYLSKRVRTVLLRGGVDNIQFRDVCRESEKKTDKEKNPGAGKTTTRLFPGGRAGGPAYRKIHHVSADAGAGGGTEAGPGGRHVLPSGDGGAAGGTR